MTNIINIIIDIIKGAQYCGARSLVLLAVFIGFVAVVEMFRH